MLQKIIDLVRAYPGTSLVFFDPPYYRFKEKLEGDDFTPTEKILESSAIKLEKTKAAPETTKLPSYLKIPIPNDPCYFSDESHLSHDGQEITTRELARLVN